MAFLLAGGACGKKDPSAAEPAPTQVAPAPTNEPTKAGNPVIAGYDALREALATDDLKAGAAAATKLAETAGAKYQAIADRAKTAAAAANLDAIRLAFGEVSKALLEAVAADAKLGEGLIAYRCPMAEGYKKWVQMAPPMRNPYMGQKMLECGSKVDMTP